MLYKSLFFGKQLRILVNDFFEELKFGIEKEFKETAYNMVNDSRAIIRDHNRIDTSTMLHGVTSLSDISGITLFSNSSRAGSSTVYSSFNEYGTKKMKGIHFIENSFNKNVENIEERLDNLITRTWNE